MHPLHPLQRVHSKQKLVDQNLKATVMAEVALVGALPQSPFVPGLLATFSDRDSLYSVYGTIIAADLTSQLVRAAEAPPLTPPPPYLPLVKRAPTTVSQPVGIWPEKLLQILCRQLRFCTLSLNIPLCPHQPAPRP